MVLIVDSLTGTLRLTSRRSKSTREGLKAQLKAPAWTVKIEMRQWVGDMAPEAEFRMFIWNGQLTSACQVQHKLRKMRGY